MRYDDSKNVSVAETLAPQDLDANATVNGDAVDLKGFNSATVAIRVGTWTDGNHSFSAQHANDDGTGAPDTFEPAAAADVVGPLPTVGDGTTDEQIYRLGYIGKRRWLRVIVTSGSVTTGLAGVAALVVLGRPAQLPVS